MTVLIFSWWLGGFGSRDTSGASGARNRRSAAAASKVSGPDEAIVVKLRAGDQSEFESLYVQQYRRLLRIATALLYGADDAEDAVQSVFIRLWNRRTELQVAGPLASYLYGAVRNEALRLLKHRRVVDRTARQLADDDIAPGMGRALAEPEETVERQDLSARIDQALQRLPERRRAALTLRWGEEMSYRDIGIALGISEQAAQMLVARAKRDLQGMLDRG